MEKMLEQVIFRLQGASTSPYLDSWNTPWYEAPTAAEGETFYLEVPKVDYVEKEIEVPQIKYIERSTENVQPPIAHANPGVVERIVLERMADIAASKPDMNDVQAPVSVASDGLQELEHKSMMIEDMLASSQLRFGFKSQESLTDATSEKS
eukprot:gnl/MRDRNA2_/MRDRNA2_26755_c0_seq1.p1 gnl/MRDRNA2_/MRDRNA2_26755_c0~~gnl/MRDRNA2_/MRDRNA2_26755_c0_seq1.p1  ORF type:complete len:151 (+),score=29.74 gnl/MRDRNA2_/MRDRNA2_26755_c0_seq1:378-830(+)